MCWSKWYNKSEGEQWMISMPVEKIVSSILSSMCQVWLSFMIYYLNETSEYNLDEAKVFFQKGYQNHSCFKCLLFVVS